MAEYRPGTHVFVRRDYANPRRDTRHKLATIADGPFRVCEVDKDTVVIQRGEQQERFTRDRVVPAPIPPDPPQTPRTAEEAEGTTENSPPPRTAGPASPINSIIDLINAPNRGLVDLPEVQPRRVQTPTGVWNRRDIGQTPPSR